MWIRCFLLCSWLLTGNGASIDSDPFIITDHPARRKVEERFQLGRPLGQLRRSTQRAETRSATRAFRSEGKAPTWTLSKKGIPCHPFQQEGKTYHGCHPEGWCCLDISCSKTDHCDVATKDQATASPPLQLPRDPVTTPCELDADGETFHWDPKDKDLNLMFLLLQEDVEGLEEEELESLVKLSSSQPLRLVLMSYKTSKDEIQELMSKTAQQLQPLIAALTPEEQDHAKQSFILASQPAWHISFDRCWLPSVTQSWSKEVTLLEFSSEYDFSVSTQPQSIRGDWAKDASDLKALTKPLRWAGGLCEEQEMDPRWPAPSTLLSGAIALVARGSCSHYHKARSAQDLGAAGIVIFSYSEQTVAMSCAAPDPCDETLQIPVLMISRSMGENLLEEMFPNVTGSDAAQGPEGPEAPEAPEVTVTLTSQRQGPDLVGVLGGGGLWYNSPIGMSRLADELIGMEHRRQLLQRREELSQSGDDVLRIEVFHRSAFPGGLTYPWPSGDAQRIRDGGYTELELELALDCEDHLDDNCPPWDHELNLYLCIEGVSPRPATCHDRRLSVARWVTPYGREAHWLSGNAAAIPLLSSAEAVAGKGTLHLHTWQHYTVSLVFWFRRTSNPSPELPRSQMPLWVGGPFDLSYNPLHQPVTFELPPATQRVMLSALITGHGWGVDEDNCAEFCDHSHHFSVNGVTNVELTKAHPTAGNEDGCKTKVSLGVVPNQYGTWPYGRAGWCPGQHVDWWEVDVTQWLQEGSNTLTYHAYFNGTDYDPEPGGLEDDLGFPAEIHLASVLTFYSVEGHEDPVELKLNPLENSRSSVLFP